MSAYGVVHAMWRELPEGVRGAVANNAALTAMKNTLSGLLLSHDDIYDHEYYQEVESEVRRSAGPIVASVLRDFAPRTLLDVGCGTGAILAAFAARGIEVTGLEYSKAALSCCRKRGLNVHEFDLESVNAAPIASHFDLVISMEVAEHLPRKIADRFVDLLTSYAANVVFTAATPGQGGKNHVNEQPHEYWIEKFSERGFEYASERSLAWREEWKSHDAASWYSRNVMLFSVKP